jgi:hypothetical protein
MVVAATASVGDTTAPRANARGERHPGDHGIRHQGDEHRREDDGPDRQDADGLPVGPDVDERGAQRRSVEKGRQEADQHHVRLDVVVGYAGNERGDDADDHQHERSGETEPAGRCGHDGHGDDQRQDLQGLSHRSRQHASPSRDSRWRGE